jgi:hypothetical protein
VEHDGGAGQSSPQAIAAPLPVTAQPSNVWPPSQFGQYSGVQAPALSMHSVSSRPSHGKGHEVIQVTAVPAVPQPSYTSPPQQ